MIPWPDVPGIGAPLTDLQLAGDRGTLARVALVSLNGPDHQSLQTASDSQNCAYPMSGGRRVTTHRRLVRYQWVAVVVARSSGDGCGAGSSWTARSLTAAV